MTNEEAHEYLEKKQRIMTFFRENFSDKDRESNGLAILELEKVISERIVFCKDCIHRDPEDGRCDCGELERAGCLFKVSDDYFCKYGERKINR